MILRRATRIALLLLAAIIVPVAALAAITYAVNPLYIYNDGAQLIHTGLRLEFADYTRLAKPMILSARQPRAVIIGSSRAEFALDPEHPFLAPGGYNAGIRGSTLEEQRRMLGDALAGADPELVVLAVSPLSLMARPTAHPGISGWGDGWRSGATGRLLFLLSPRQWWLAWRAMRAPEAYAGEGMQYRANGQRDRDFFSWRVRAIGHFRMFRAALSKVAKARHLRLDPAVDTTTAMVRMAAGGGRRVVVVVEPIHAAAYALRKEGDFYGQVGGFVSSLQSAVGTLPGVRIWDCSVGSGRNLEMPPRNGDKQTQMRWWWDGDHYTALYGDAILATISGQDAGDAACIAADAVDYRQRREDARATIETTGDAALQVLGLKK